MGVSHNFKGRKVIKDKTLELSASDRCRFVITHKSTSISYAVFYKKPIIFLDVFSGDSTYRKGIKKLSRFFKSEIINFKTAEKKISLENIKKLNKSELEKYEDYIQQFLNASKKNRVRPYEAILEALNACYE